MNLIDANFLISQKYLFIQLLIIIKYIVKHFLSYAYIYFDMLKIAFRYLFSLIILDLNKSNILRYKAKIT